MKALLIVSLATLFTIGLTAQSNVSTFEDTITNSYKRIYDKSNPSLRYSYDEFSKTHNYSGNWDFDNDGVLDSLLFIGNNGAHLYFHLRIVLSHDKKVRDFPFIINDMPILRPIDDLIVNKNSVNWFPKFVVYDFFKTGRMSLFVKTDTAFAQIPKKWKKKGVFSPNLILVYDQNKKDILIKEFTKIE